MSVDTGGKATPLFEESTRAFLSRAWRQEDAQPDAQWRTKRALAATLHELVCATSKSDAPQEVLASVHDAMQTQLAQLNRHPQRSFREALADGSYFTDPKRYTDRVFTVGASNAAVPPLALSFDGEVALGRVTFDESCVGAPGWAHGGIVAAMFDQAMGYRLICEGLPVVTGELTVRYLQPTPLLREVEFRALLESKDGRRAHMGCEAWVDDLMLARAQAVFVIIPKGSWKL